MPKNVMQIGTPDDFYRIYMEDYVYTYIRQLENETGIDRRKVYLFGKKENSEDNMILYIYGAADSEKGILSIQHDFFSEYDILGIMSLYHSKKEISLQNGIVFSITGFFVFYEQNMAMQSFLVHNYQENERDKEISDNGLYSTQEKQNYSRKTYRKEILPKKENTTGNLLYCATFGMAIVICIIAITTINQYDKMQGFNSDILQAANILESTTTEYEPDTTFYIEEVKEPTSTDVNSEEELATSMMTTKDDAEDMKEVDTKEIEESESVVSYQEYIVKEGDNLASICRQYYGNDDQVKVVCSLNKIENPDNIQPGQKILLP